MNNPKTLTAEMIAVAEIEAKRRSCSLEGYRFIAEQLAELDGKPVLIMDLIPIIAQAKFALKAERELRLDAARESVDCSTVKQQTVSKDAMGQSEAEPLRETPLRDLRGEGASEARPVLLGLRSALLRMSGKSEGPRS